MEIVFSKNKPSIINTNKIIGIYGDKNDLINRGFKFNNIYYDENWTIRRFLNGYKIKMNNDVIGLFNEFDLNKEILNKKIKDISNGLFKICLLIYALLYIKDIIYLNYFEKGLSYKYKKKIINYLKRNNMNNIIVISNDLIFLNSLCYYLIVFKDNKIIYEGDFNNLYNSNIRLDYPEIIEFIKMANKHEANLDFTINTNELAKDIYRSVM